MKGHLALLLASGLYIGFLPGAPGTYASLATTLAFYLTYRLGSGVLPGLHVSILCLVATAGVLASAETSETRGEQDPGIVVIDEVAGQLTTFLWVPVTTTNLLLGTVLFRIFDVWKPYPIRRVEHLGHGVGIMADDLIAGVYANLLLQLVDMFTRG